MNQLKAFGRFCYDFLVGDDWKIAAAVAAALTAVGAMVAGHVLGDHALAVVGGLLVATLFVASLLIDVRLADRRSRPVRRGDEGAQPGGVGQRHAAPAGDDLA
jgi:hypothetical protein